MVWLSGSDTYADVPCTWKILYVNHGNSEFAKTCCDMINVFKPSQVYGKFWSEEAHCIWLCAYLCPNHRVYLMRGPVSTTRQKPLYSQYIIHQWLPYLLSMYTLWREAVGAGATNLRDSSIQACSWWCTNIANCEMTDELRLLLH